MEPVRTRLRSGEVDPPPEMETPVESEAQEKVLSNPYILAAMFSHFSVEDLWACRLVNKTWNEEATRQIAPMLPVLVLKGHRPIEMKDLTQLWDTLSSSWDFPCRKFSFLGHLLKNCSPREKDVLPKILDNVAPVAIHLKMATDIDFLMPSGKLEYGKLKSLELEISDKEEESELKSNVDFMITILENSPILSSLSLRFFAETNAEYLRLLGHVPWKQIRHLQLHGKVQDAHFRKIIMDSRRKMKLESFDIATNFLHVTPPPLGKPFQQFLEQQSGSLETLKLQFGRQKPGEDFTFPPLSNLKRLEVRVYQRTMSLGNEPSILALPSYSRVFPKLNSFSLYIWELAANWSEFHRFLSTEDRIPVESVRELELDAEGVYGHVNLDVESACLVVRQLAQMFPRVRKLTIPAHHPLLEAIGKEKVWKDLEVLRMTFRLMITGYDAFTGWTIPACADYLEMDPGTRECRTEGRSVVKRIPAFLHEVKVLELRQQREGITYTLSDVACHLVLLKLKKLQCLDLWQLRTHQVSEEMIRRMRGKFRVLENPKSAAPAEVLK